jgi:hypothetical protein
MIEASDATLRAEVKRDDVYPMFKSIITKLSTNTAPEQGKLITECYDLQRHRPSVEYFELINRVRKEFADCGLLWE